MVGCLSCALAGFVGFGFASAGMGASENVDFFGIEAVSESTSADAEQQEDAASDTPRESNVLASTTSRDISQAVADIQAQKEAEKRAAEEAARKEEEAHIAAAQEAKAQRQAAIAQEGSANMLASLPDVDWSVGKDDFLSEWTERIDAYLVGSPLAGKGAVFAQAAWEYGVDPRWSPAISNTESSKGSACFKSYNAWGWMSSDAWTNWDQAIYAHVKGLSKGYGYSITVSNAKKYCPPTYMDWFNKTLDQMKAI